MARGSWGQSEYENGHSRLSQYDYRAWADRVQWVQSAHAWLWALIANGVWYTVARAVMQVGFISFLFGGFLHLFSFEWLRHMILWSLLISALVFTGRKRLVDIRAATAAVSMWDLVSLHSLFTIAIHVLSAYWVGSALLATVHSAHSSAPENPIYQQHELYAILLFALYAGFSHVMSTGHGLNFPYIQRPVHRRLLAAVPSCFCQAVYRALILSHIWVALHFVYHGMSALLGLRAMLPTFFCIVAIDMGWRLVSALMEICYTEHVAFVMPGLTGADTLISGLQDVRDPYMQRLAYFDLFVAVERSHKRRTELYTEHWEKVNAMCHIVLETFCKTVYDAVEVLSTEQPGLVSSAFSGAVADLKFAIGHAQTLTWAANALSLLMAKAPEEGQAAVARGSIREVLEALLESSMAVSEAVAHTPPSLYDRALGLSVKSAEAAALQTALQMAIMRVITTYPEDVRQLKLAPEYTDLLNKFLCFDQ